MDHVFSPWRYAYVSAERPKDECILCELVALDRGKDEERFIVARGEHNLVVLNLYPYNSGHVMIVPYQHVSRLAALPDAPLTEMARLAARAEIVLGEVYRAEGLNLGMNLGRSAGAGIADHIHLHVVPRWVGDTNFISVAGETRVLPEDLRDTWRKLRGRF